MPLRDNIDFRCNSNFYLVRIFCCYGNEGEEYSTSSWKWVGFSENWVHTPFLSHGVLFRSVMALVGVLYRIEMYFNEGIMRLEVTWK